MAAATKGTMRSFFLAAKPQKQSHTEAPCAVAPSSSSSSSSSSPLPPSRRQEGRFSPSVEDSQKNKNVLKLAVKCLGCVFLFQECDKTEPSLIFMVRRSFSSRRKKPQTLAAFWPPHHAPGTPLTVSVNFVPLQTGVYCPPPPSARHAHFYPPFPPCLSACCNLILLPGLLLLLLRDDSHFPPFTAKSKQLLCWLWRRRVRLPAGFIKLIRAAGPTDPPAPPPVLSSSVADRPTDRGGENHLQKLVTDLAGVLLESTEAAVSQRQALVTLLLPQSGFYQLPV